MTFPRLAALLLLVALPALSQSTSFTLVSGDPGMVDHWPAADSYVGTADDLINGNLSPVNGSAPNSNGSYCYNAFNFYSGQTDPGIPSPYDAITFIEGSVDIDLDAVGERVPLAPWITGLNITQGTPPFPGHAAYSASFTAINDWTFWGSNYFIINVDFAASLGGSPDTALNMEMEGQIYVVEAADYGTPTGYPYVDQVVIPRAQAQQASRLVFMWAMGTVPPAQGGSWGSMPMLAVLVGFTDAVATSETSWSGLRTIY